LSGQAVSISPKLVILASSEHGEIFLVDHGCSDYMYVLLKKSFAKLRHL